MQCPDCGAAVHGVETRAPGTHLFDPCGCSATALTARDLADLDRGRGLATDGGTSWPSGTERVEVEDVELTPGGDLVEVTRVHYHRSADDSGRCPFCRSAEDVEFVDETGPGGTYRKQRFECDCGAYGEGVWTWEAGQIEAEQSGDGSPELATDGGVPTEETDRTIEVYLGKVTNAWGRGDELVAGTMAKAKDDIEARAREIASYIDDADLPDEPEWRDHAVEDDTQVWDVDDWQIVVQTHQIEKDGGPEDCAVCGEPVEADPATGDATVTEEGLAHEECAIHDDRVVLPDGGITNATTTSVRVGVTDDEITWYTSKTAYERLENHPTGNLVIEIEDDVTDRDGDLFDVVVAPTGAYWVMEADDE